MGDTMKEIEETLRVVLPVTGLDTLMAAVVTPVREKELRAAEKLIKHFFALPGERKAFIKMLNARYEALAFEEAR